MRVSNEKREPLYSASRTILLNLWHACSGGTYIQIECTEETEKQFETLLLEAYTLEHEETIKTAKSMAEAALKVPGLSNEDARYYRMIKEWATAKEDIEELDTVMRFFEEA